MTRVIAGRICHESHSFSVLPTTLADFAQMELLFGDDIRRLRTGTRSEMGGFIDGAQAYGWDVAWTVSANTAPSGPLTRTTYEALLEPILRAIRGGPPPEAVVLSLHGSMYVEGLPDPEGDLLRRVRAAAGAKTVVAAALDLHANVTDEMVEQADLITSYRTTPHVDQYETGRRLCDLVERTLRGQLRPRMAVARRPMLLGMDLGRTLGDGPMVRLLGQARGLEAGDRRIADISLHPGFPYGDVREGGPSVLVIADGDASLARAAAEQLMDQAQASRDQSTVHLVPVAEAVERARQPARSAGPIILAEYTDGPGGGAYGDATLVLAALLEADLPGTVVGALYDPQTARECIALGVGRQGTFRVGGKTDARYGGGPVEVTGQVSAVSDGLYTRKGPFETGTRASLGPCACIDVGNVRIIVASYRVQAEDREQYRILGIQPESVNVLALKGINHFRADFEAVAREIVFVEAGGIAASDPSIFPWQHLRRPIWPLDAGA